MTDTDGDNGQLTEDQMNTDNKYDFTEFGCLLHRLGAYWLAINADAAWQNELGRLYGKRATTVRYSPQGCGKTGTELRRLADAACAANEQWRVLSRDMWATMVPEQSKIVPETAD